MDGVIDDHDPDIDGKRKAILSVKCRENGVV